MSKFNNEVLAIEVFNADIINFNHDTKDFLYLYHKINSKSIAWTDELRHDLNILLKAFIKKGDN